MTSGAFYLFRTPESVDQMGPGMLAFIRATVAERGPQFVKHGDYQDKRTLDQNALFHALCGDIAGYWNANRAEKTTAEAVKRDLKVRFGLIVTEYSPVTDQRQARIESTARYTKHQLADLITATLAWAAEQGIPLPDPRSEA